MSTRTLFAFLVAAALAPSVLAQQVRPKVRVNDDNRQRRVYTHGSVTYGRGTVRQPTQVDNRARVPDRNRAPDRNVAPQRNAVPERDRVPERVVSRDRWGHQIDFGVDVQRDRARKVEIRINQRHPREVRPIPYGTRVVSLPYGARTVVYSGATYYESDGIFFTAGVVPSAYVVVRPPIGVVVSALPSDYQVVVIDDQPYYVYDDTYYDMDLHVVEIPIGGYVDTLPPDCQVVDFGGETYFSFSGDFFRPFLRDGRTFYMRVDVRR